MKPESYPALDGVVLVRLLVRPKGFTVARLASDIESLLAIAEAQAREAVDGALARLKERGFIWPDTKLQLNDEGEATALAEIGFTALPTRQRPDWRWAKKALLVRQLATAPEGAGQVNASPEQAAAWLIASKHGILVERASQRKDRAKKKRAPTSGVVLRALAWRALASLERDAPKRSDDKPAPRPAVSDSSTAPALLPPPADLAGFARAVNEIALTTKDGRWLGHKVFIGQIWKDFVGQAEPDLTIDRFKKRLVAAARAGLVTLSRADLIAVLPKDQVQQSRTDDGDRTYHFVETQQLG